MSLYPETDHATGRRRITVAQWANRPDDLVDEYAYYFNPEAEAMGLECWRLVEGIDPHIRRGLYDIDFANGTYCTVEDCFPLYVTADHAEALQCGS